MPGTRCAIAVCQNSLQATKKKNLNISYHTFPKDPKLCNVWIKACRREGEWNPKTSTICSVHFLEDQFEVDLRSQLMNIKTKRRLITSAVPTQNLKENYVSNISTDLTSRQVCANKRHNATIVKNLIRPTEDNNNAQGNENITQEYHDKLYGMSPAFIEESIEVKYQNLLIVHEKLKTKYKHLLQFKRVQKHRILTLNNNFNMLSQKCGELISKINA